MAIALLVLSLFLSPAPAQDELPGSALEWIAILGTDREATRFEAISALIALGEESVAPCLAVMNDLDESPVRRWQAAMVLGKTGSADTIPELVRVALEDPVEVVARVAEEAAKALIESQLDGDSGQAYLDQLGTTLGWQQPPIVTGTAFVEALPWAVDLESAQERAKAENKLVLATVVAISDSRWSSGYRDAPSVWTGMDPPRFGDERSQAMDPGLVKERALMATLFSDPEIAHWTREHFVPVRIRAHTFHFDLDDRKVSPLAALEISAKDLGGTSLVVARPDGEVVYALRRMGVLSVPMIRSALPEVLRAAGYPAPAEFEHGKAPALDRAWSAIRRGDLASAQAHLAELGDTDPARKAEALYLRGHVAAAVGEEDAARELWAATSEMDAMGAYGGKAALRLSECGVQIAEWETMEEFAVGRTPGTTEVGGGRKPEFQDAVTGAVRFLLANERAGGEWRDPFYDITNGAGPGSRFDKTVPRTALVTDALMQASRVLEDPDLERAAAAAIERGTARVGQFADAPSPFVWHLTYALHLQVALLRGEYGDQELARTRAATLIDSLKGIQSEGGWSYMGAPRIHSFNTAPVLLLLTEAKALGVEVPAGMERAAAEFLESVREEEDGRNFAYAPTMRFPVRASSCRTALCELALAEYAGEPRRTEIAKGVALLLEHDVEVRATTKVYESSFSSRSLQDAYHYYFGHYYAARALGHLPRSSARKLAKQQIKIILYQHELDGSFVDAEMQGKCYSTAMALLALLQADRQR